MNTPTDADLRAFADRNFERYQDLRFSGGEEPTAEDQRQAGVVEVDHPDFLIAHPYLDESTRFAVDPVEHYGAENFEKWKAAAIAAMEKGL